MQSASIASRVIGCVALIARIKPEEIGVGSSLVSDIGLDSLDIIEIVMAVEEEFEIDLDDVEVNKCATVGDLANVVEKHFRSE